MYGLIEILFRGWTHPTMLVLGGLCFVIIGEINEVYPWEMPLVSQMLISSIVVTFLEFIFGLVLNVWLKLGIWDYSGLPYNLCGQICLIFTIAWFFISLLAIVVDDIIRWKFYGEQKPKYYIFYCKK